MTIAGEEFYDTLQLAFNRWNANSRSAGDYRHRWPTPEAQLAAG